MKTYVVDSMWVHIVNHFAKIKRKISPYKNTVFMFMYTCIWIYKPSFLQVDIFLVFSINT